MMNDALELMSEWDTPGYAYALLVWSDYEVSTPKAGLHDERGYPCGTVLFHAQLSGTACLIPTATLPLVGKLVRVADLRFIITSVDFSASRVSIRGREFPFGSKL